MDVSVANYFNKVEKIISRGGPEPSEYNFSINIPSYDDISLELAANIYKTLTPILDKKSLLGHTFHKPYGYAGDFELIDRIYSGWMSEDEKFHKWDKLYHKLDCSIAVRNRKKYFVNTLLKLKETTPNARVLNLGSGPCTDLFEYLSQNGKNSMVFDCLDMDDKAINFGSSVCDNYMDSITFINKNAFRFKPSYQYDFIWSAGLFDYFSDKLFVRLLNRIYALLSDGGEMVIGNFSTDNPSRGMMEVFAQWYLHHRDEKLLIELAIKAGIPEENLSVKSEELGVNLFLHAKK